MIELVVSAHGLFVQDAMYAVVLTDARERVQVVEGAAHPPTYVAVDAAWGLYEAGGRPGSAGLEEWLRAVYGQDAGSLLPLRRVNVVNDGDGIAISAPRAGSVKLRIRPANGGSVVERMWAGPADYSVDGVINMDDLTAFLNAWMAGAGDFDGDGESTGMDLTEYLAWWQNGGQPVCQADLNRDGAVDVFDLLMYLDWFHTSDSRADLQGVSPGSVDVFDLTTFMGWWLEGC